MAHNALVSKDATTDLKQTPLSKLHQTPPNKSRKSLNWLHQIPLKPLHRHQPSKPDETRFNDPREDVDFVGLHNVAKHIIFMKESIEAFLSTTASMLETHEKLYTHRGRKSPSKQIFTSTYAALKYQRELFLSLSLRIMSLDRRMQNTINLVRIGTTRFFLASQAACCAHVIVNELTLRDQYLVFQSRCPARQPNHAK